MAKYFYESFDLEQSKFNITYHEILQMNPSEFDAWLDALKAEILHMWDTQNRPPVRGKSEKDIIEDFMQLKYFNTDAFLKPDKDSLGLLINFVKLSSGVNQFFPTMNKTKIREANAANSYSIYDFFTLPELDRRYKVTLRRILKRDAMYSYSKSLYNDVLNRGHNDVPYHGEDAETWIRNFKANAMLNRTYGLWISDNKEEVDIRGCVQIEIEQIKRLYHDGVIGDVELSNIGSIDDVVPTHTTKNGKVKKITYLIRYYDKSKKIYPEIIQVFQVALTQRPVNFPSLFAKWIYEKYTSHIPPDETAIVYDPSAGWGGRIIGAMSSRKKIHYVGTDPNKDNFISELGITRYEYVADFYNKNCIQTSNSFFDFGEEPNTYHIFQDGSEEIHKNPDFQQYKGKIDLVFTSPPYFNREQYSQDITQSSIKYDEYNDWRDNFLDQTLKTAVEYTKKGGYILWNIANIRLSENNYLPLEQDSKDILEKYGCEIVGEYKMIMSNMIGQKINNCVKYNGQDYKFEPIIVARKK